MSTYDTLLDEKDIDRIISRMAYEIVEIHKGVQDLALIGIQTRGVFLANRLHAKISEIEGVTLDTGIIDITMYRDDWTRIGKHPIVKATDVSFSVDDRQIILVDDVLFTGRTIRSALDALVDFGRAARIELAVLVDRGHREVPIQANYIGKIVETKRKERVNVMLKEHDDVDKVVIERS